MASRPAGPAWKERAVSPTLAVFGLGVGILVGMTGVGGGSLMTPLLILVFGVKPVTAIGTDLAYGAVTKTVGGWRHWRQKTVDLSMSTWMAFGSVPAAVAGVFVLKKLERSEGAGFDSTILVLVAIALLLCAVTMLARLFFPAVSDREQESATLTPARKVLATSLGVVIGFVLGITSAGSGSLIAVALILLFRLTPRRVVGTDVFHAAVLLWAAALAHLVAGDIDFGLAGNILVGSIPGVWLGTRWSVLVPVGALRVALGLLLLGSGLALLAKAGASVPTPVLAVFPVSVLALAAYVILRRPRDEPSSPAPGKPFGAAVAPTAE
ncbi:MAG: uncharacterized protein QOF77_741 [Solirubrobacteraceae bacterium]|jgi:uncharacterized membrane protein YfcA|nr:uncharacterized protein [Solirubrobacteraceae bacterium]